MYEKRNRRRHRCSNVYIIYGQYIILSLLLLIVVD